MEIQDLEENNGKKRNNGKGKKKMKKIEMEEKIWMEMRIAWIQRSRKIEVRKNGERG